MQGLELPDWPEPLTIGSIQFANETFDLQLIEDFGEGTQYFSATIRAAIDAVGLLPKGQAFASGLTITATDYNHHYSEVALSFDCQIEFQVRYEAGDGGSAEAELIGITDAQLT